MRHRAIVWTAATALILLGYAIGRADTKDEASATVKVTSADHETQEGYFSLGDNLTVMAKPGSDFYRFLASHRDQTVTITVTEGTARQVSTLRR